MNQHTLFLVDQSKKPSGMTIAIAGGSALSNGGVPFTGGSGTDDVSAALTAMASDQQDYIAAAQNDTTNAGRFETDVNAKAAFDIGLLEQYVLSSNSIQATAIALGQTQMNDALGQCIWVPLGVEHPSRVAARVAALRSVTEGADPNHNYDDAVIPGASPQFQSADYPTRTVKKAALNASLTICTTVDGTLRIVRSITSRSLNGATPDYRCLDSGCATVPIRVRKEVVSRYATLLKPANPNSGPDLDDNLLPPDGTLTPGVWEADTNGLLQGFEDLGWLQKVAANPAVGQWDSVGKRIMGLVPTIVADLDHQLGVIVRQIAS
jgi:phage tail sheath gpL-like